VLKWVFERVAGDAGAVETPIGLLPEAKALDTTGLDVSDDDLATLLQVDVDGWKGAIPQIRDHFDRFGDKLPAQLSMAVDALEAKLG
jgi:phosphoenolpyruvate carboxykinase (GTP)